MKKKMIYAIMFLTVLAVAGIAAAERGVDPVRMEDEAPNFTLETTDGDTVSLSDYAGKVVLLDFWDTWCPPCKKGIPELIELYEEYKDEGFVVIGMALGRMGEKAVEEYTETHNITYPVVHTTDEVVNSFGSIEAIPTAFLVNREGNIVKKYVGLRPKTEFINDITPLLNSGSE